MILDDNGARGLSCALAQTTSVRWQLQRALEHIEHPPSGLMAATESKMRDLNQVLDCGGAKLGGEFADTAARFAALRQELSKGLRANAGTAVVFLDQKKTYGVYMPTDSGDLELQRWTVQNGLPPALALPGIAKVLFCLAAQEQSLVALRKHKSHKAAGHSARAFQRCVLVHEHFHAIVENGLDERGELARGSQFTDAWATAMPLNESLAVWMEFHSIRDNPELSEIVRAYMNQGKYPEWPYAGGERVEQLYKEGGLEAVRRLVSALRNDPETARRSFERVGPATSL